MPTNNFFQFFRHYGLPGIFLLVVLENMGIPAPTEIAYVFAQALITSGKTSYLVALLVLTLAHVTGSVLSYAVGRGVVGGFKNQKENLKKTESRMVEWYQRYGMYATFIARFVGQVRPWSSYVAGVAKEPFVPFVVLTTVGSLLFSIISLAITNTLTRLWLQYPVLRIGISAFFVISILAGLWFLTKKKKPLPSEHTER